MTRFLRRHGKNKRMVNNIHDEVITMAHGSGGASSAELMQRVFSKHFHNEILGRLEDSAVVDLAADRSGDGAGVDSTTVRAEVGAGAGTARSDGRLAISTDTFVVTPLVFPGGDIGKLAVCGTVNDVLMSGATPRWLTCGFILETGLSIEFLDCICVSLAKTAAEAGVTIIAGDTKVIEGRGEGGESNGEGGGLMINTTGIGVFEGDADISPAPSGIRLGDAIIVSGNLGDHHAAILSARMGIQNNIQSDCALLTPIVKAMREADIGIHAMRDVTRGGLATVLNELAEASGVSIELEENSIPVSREVKAFCGIMGLDPLYMGNEGKVIIAVAPEDAVRALAAIQETEIGKNAAIIGSALQRDGALALQRDGIIASPLMAGNSVLSAASSVVYMKTRVGGTVRLDVLYGEGLPRIC